MIEQLKSAGDQLRTALDNYCRVYSSIQHHPTLGTLPYAPKFPPELTHQLDIELAFISRYKAKIRKIKATISRARNYCSGVAPINFLPPEILARIFHFLRPQACDQVYPNFGLFGQCGHRYPDYLTQVCTLWRKVAISTRALWSHIDLCPYEPNHDALTTRAEEYVTRAGHLPLELHISLSLGSARESEIENRDYNDLYELISRMVNRVESLELVASDHFRDLHRSVLSQLLFSHPSKLTKFMICSETGHHDPFVYARDTDPDDSDEEFEDFRLDLTEDQIESGFAPLTVLHLEGIFPIWSSVAYHGLTDLRLSSSDSLPRIGEEEFATILSSSPGLQILHFGLELDGLTTGSEEISRVYLQDLQVVKIFPVKSGTSPRGLCPSWVLRLLAPGVKPLRLYFGNRYEPAKAFDTEFESFFARSRVARFYTHDTFLPMSILLRHAVHLEQVILEYFEHSMFTPSIPRTWLQVDELDSLPRLKSFYAIKSNFSENELHWLVNCCPVGVVLDSCNVKLDDSEESTYEEFAYIFPTVRIADTPPYLSDFRYGRDILD
ncbi:unnamed protein product [Rhizoctonia solani]|uniref:F-box domain-containing protein n=1 Tax=Rhizoctonia solani TaxID=456999 RepID=A0A8H3E0R4_9AGAM|nr:unnamed protein product [Rhizoctonia solani]